MLDLRERHTFSDSCLLHTTTHPAGPKLFQGLKRHYLKDMGVRERERERQMPSSILFCQSISFIEASFMSYILLSEELGQRELGNAERGRKGGAW